MLVVAAIFVAILIWDRLPLATTSLSLLGLLSLGFALFPFETAEGPFSPSLFFAGFGHPALIAICSLMVLGQGLVLTGALQPLSRVLSDWIRRAPGTARLAVLCGGAFCSALINDTPVVVLLIPLIVSAAGSEANRTLLPMNYAVLIGGMATTIGTSTNLIVVSMASGMGIGPFEVFGFSGMVAAAALPALLYLWLLAPRLLSRIGTQAEEVSAPVFDAELTVAPESWLEGKELREVLADGRVCLTALFRGGRPLARLPTLKLRRGDGLILRDTAARLKAAERRFGSPLHGVDLEAAERTSTPDSDGSDARVVAQMIVGQDSPLAGKTVRDERIAERYGLIVVGIRPRSERLLGAREGDPASRRLAAGDILLVQGRVQDIQEAQHDQIGLLLDARLALPRWDRAPFAIAVMALVVVAAATKLLPISTAALGGVAVLLLGRVVSWGELTQSLSAKIVMLVAASLALGTALEVTGATGHIAHLLAERTRGLDVPWVIGIVMALMGLLTNVISNNAAAALGTPLAIDLARSLGAPPEPFVLAVLFGCNLCYLTPMGYQTNLLVMNAGGYRFSDYLRVGAPLFALMWLALTCALIARYGV